MALNFKNIALTGTFAATLLAAGASQAADQAAAVSLSPRSATPSATATNQVVLDTISPT